MKIDYQKYTSLEDFINDIEFVKIVRENDILKQEKLQVEYPDKKYLMEKAALFIKYIEIKQADIPQGQIEDDWGRLISEIDKVKVHRRRKKLFLWASTAAASVIILLFVLFHMLDSDRQGKLNQENRLFTLLEAASLEDVDEVRVIAGDNQTIVDNEKTIQQTENGSLLVGENETISSSEIDAEYVTIVVPKGKRTTIKFSDGTMAWVNSGSKLVYPKVFGKQSRDIVVDGEIYLDVTTDKNRPFHVRTQNFEVKVLGTQFNINAYSDDEANSVVLVEGSVEISGQDMQTKLLPRQGFFIENNTPDVKNVDVYPYVSWKEGIMKLSGEPLYMIMKRLSRYYGIDIYFEEQFGKEKYVGKLNMKDSIEATLKSLSLSTPFKYTREENTIYINNTNHKKN